jgi:hypothetical protein
LIYSGISIPIEEIFGIIKSSLILVVNFSQLVYHNNNNNEKGGKRGGGIINNQGTGISDQILPC